MRFKILDDNDSEQTYVSKKLNNGDFDYYLVIQVLNMPEYVGDECPYRWSVSLLSVSPSEAGEEHLKRAFESMCMEDSPHTELTKVSALVSYGVYAQLWTDGGNNLREQLKEARKQASASSVLFGFMMDKAENRIGSNGWDFIKGDIDAGLRRYKEGAD